MTDLIFVGKWLSFPISAYRGLSYREWAGGPYVHHSARLFLDGVPGGYLTLGDAEYNQVWEALQTWQEFTCPVREALGKAVGK